MQTEPEPNATEWKQAVKALRVESELVLLQSVGRMLWIALFAGCLLAALGTWNQAEMRFSLLGAALLLGLGGVALLAVERGRQRAGKQRRGALDQPLLRQNTRAIGPLYDALALAPARRAAAIHAMLVPLLSQLRADQEHGLTPRQLRYLDEELMLADADRDQAYSQAVLRALSVVGDRVSWDRISLLTQRPAATQGQRNLRHAACAILPVMEARLAQERENALLLRAAAPADTPAELLRAAPPAADPQPETLLRPKG